MVKKTSKNNLNKKRGISTIVGGMIFLVLLTAGFSTFFLAMDVQSDTIGAQLSVSNSVIEKTQEQFDIAVATDESNNYQLGIHVKNKGPNPLEISDIWIINKTLASQPATKIAINYSDAFLPPGYGSSILDNQLLYMTPNEEYDIKVISTLGTIKKAELSVGGNNYLLAEMYTIPPDVRQGENATIALRVTNVGPTKLSGVVPDALLLDDALPPHAQVDSVEAVSISPVDLNPSESIIFSWHATLKSNANVGIKVKFSNFATGTESVTGFLVTSNMASDKIIIRDPQGGSGETIVLEEDLYSKPGVFIIIPSPFGDRDNDQALWGVNVANPTESIMNVTKVVFSVDNPAGGGGSIFKTACDRTNISPPPIGGNGDWTCEIDNQLRWKNADNPIQIPPKSVYPFLVKTETAGVGGGPAQDLESFPVQVTVVTSSGQFGKAGYDSSMNVGGSEVMANVFLGNHLGTTNTNNINSSRVVPINTIDTYEVWLVDFQTDSGNLIKGQSPNNKKTNLIINIPQDWVVQLPINPADNPDWIVTHTLHPDSSSQIIGRLKTDFSSGGKRIKFDMLSPTIADPKMYVMHATANGISDDDFTVSPLSEIILKVQP